MGAGRPTKYKEEFVAKVDEYLALCVDEEVQRVKSEGGSSTTYELGIKVNLPSIEGLAIFLNVAVSTIYVWAEAHREFSEALEAISKAQKKVIIEKGLAGTYNPMIAKLVLSANHGMVERADVTSGGEKFSVNVIDWTKTKNENDNDSA